MTPSQARYFQSRHLHRPNHAEARRLGERRAQVASLLLAGPQHADAIIQQTGMPPLVFMRVICCTWFRSTADGWALSDDGRAAVTQRSAA